jgi:hypothetical protein
MRCESQLREKNSEEGNFKFIQYNYTTTIFPQMTKNKQSLSNPLRFQCSCQKKIELQGIQNQQNRKFKKKRTK